MPRPLIANRRDRILDACESLVLDHGFDAMSIATVATQVGIAKGAVYREFTSKRDILESLLQRGAERLRERVETELSDEPTLSEGYSATVHALLADPLMTAAFLDDRGVLGSHAETVTDDRFRTHHAAIASWVSQMQTRGDFDATIDPDHFSLALSSATIGLLSASRLLGPLTATQLKGALTSLARMIAAFELNEHP